MKKTLSLSAFATAAGTSGPALAHHAMGGEVPETLFTGFVSGLAHPVIGIDHLAFIIAMGLAAAFTPKRFMTPLAFVAATLAGCGLLLAGIALPLAEIVITGSVVLVGAMVLSGRRFPAGGYVALFAIAGLFHGWAYGASILGAEATPLAAYLTGFAAIQYAIALGVMAMTRTLWRAADPSAIAPRLTGALMAGIGFAFLVENIEGLLAA
ncbi:MAG: HupE/UreJ family protein [Alphaproteobacteria bacterium]